MDRFFKPTWGKIGLTILLSLWVYDIVSILLELLLPGPPYSHPLCLPGLLPQPTPTPTPVSPPNNPLQGAYDYWFKPIPGDCNSDWQITSRFSQLFVRVLPSLLLIFPVVISYLLSCIIIFLIQKRKNQQKNKKH